ncbi:MAG: oligosaccharide flippase family protein, partial [Reinekea sp.]|nr:oligosaccharide flippase family protein [Reinekea sp.]
MVENYRKKVLGGFAWEAGTKVFVQILSWISTILVARVLSPDDYGLVLISGIFTGLVGMIAGLGVSSGMVQRDSVSHEDASTVFWLSVILGSFFYA